VASKRVFVGFACDNACVFCAQGSMREHAPSPDVEAQIAAIEKGDDVFFAGGEPLIHPELVDWIGRAIDRGAARVVVQTNGRKLAGDDLIGKLAAAAKGLLSLDVSLHGSTAAMHDYHTQIDGSFAATTAGLDVAKRAKIPFGVTIVVTRSNFRHLVELAELAAKLGAKAIHFAGAEPFGSALLNEARVVPAPELVIPHLARAASVAHKLGLGVVAASVAEPAASRGLFAGLGVAEPL
jgi:MoaA/NifB/PqqE/SkfB family radical SAM enzyme